MLIIQTYQEIVTFNYMNQLVIIITIILLLLELRPNFAERILPETTKWKFMNLCEYPYIET